MIGSRNHQKFGPSAHELWLEECGRMADARFSRQDLIRLLPRIGEKAPVEIVEGREFGEDLLAEFPRGLREDPANPCSNKDIVRVRTHTTEPPAPTGRAAAVSATMSDSPDGRTQSLTAPLRSPAPCSSSGSPGGDEFVLRAAILLCVRHFGTCDDLYRVLYEKKWDDPSPVCLNTLGINRLAERLGYRPVFQDDPSENDGRILWVNHPTNESASTPFHISRSAILPPRISEPLRRIAEVNLNAWIELIGRRINESSGNGSGPRNPLLSNPKARTGRRRLEEAKHLSPAMEALLNTYRIIRAAVQAHPGWGPKALMNYFRGNKEFRKRVGEAKRGFDEKLFRAALDWIKGNPGQETQSGSIT
ncbi:MAG: hypothetical protein JWO38_1107 [Gemmataceae bacterium]|nr:hypothetical protein [Gemmataceae bacterium]